jgi:V/A-type H+-transporting ATPase subunit E
MAKLEARNKILGAKQNKLQAVFDRVLKSLVDLPEKEYLEIFKTMLKRAVKGGEEVIVSERDRKRITPEFLSQIDPSFKLSSETRDMSGGFVLKSGRIETNSSFEVLLSSTRRELEPEVLKTLLTS